MAADQISSQVASIVNNAAFAGNEVGSDFSIGMNVASADIGNTPALALAMLPGSTKGAFEEISLKMQANAEITRDASDHNITYNNLYQLLQQSLQHNTTPMPQQVTYLLIMAYLMTHLFQLKSHKSANPVDDFTYTSPSYHCKDKTRKQHTFQIYDYALSETLQTSPPEMASKFYHLLALLVHAQLETNYYQMYQDAVLRIQYVLGSFYTLNRVEQQQQTSIDLLTQLSDYVNEQVTEYSSVYERLHTLIDTQNRKITFQAGDVQTLERWQFWCKVAFWGLVVFFVLMVIVDSAMDISRFTSDMDDRLKRAASAASQATQALVRPSPGAGPASV